jgi:hypothetical protein
MRWIKTSRFNLTLTSFLAALLLIALSFLYGISSFHLNKAEASTQAPLTGWLWSETIGWIDTNCQNQSGAGCSTFGLTIDSVSGAITGYAWSENIGWVSANHADVLYCETNYSGSDAVITGSAVTGWLRAVAGNTSNSGGWDGCINLSGITYSSGSFSGYAWGDMNVGWVDFSLARSTFNTCPVGDVYTCVDPLTIKDTHTDASCTPTITTTSCTAPQFCSTGLSTCQTPTPGPFSNENLSVKPNLIPKNATTTVFWGIVNVVTDSCRVTASDTNVIPLASPWAHNFSATATCPVKFTSSGNTGCQSSLTIPSITQPTTFTITCTDFNGQPFTQTATVNLLPDYQER